MLRVFAIAATFALALPTFALAQGGPHEEHGKGGPPQRAVGHPGGPVPHPGPPRAGGPMPHPGGPGPHVGGPVPHRGGPVPHPGPMIGGHPGPIVRPGGPVRVGGPVVRAPWVFHGHPYAWHPVHFPRPWIYPPGYAYRSWAVGAILPPLFWRSSTYYYPAWAEMGLPPPEPGYQYVQYGPDLLLVNVTNGEVVQAFPGAFE